MDAIQPWEGGEILPSHPLGPLPPPTTRPSPPNPSPVRVPLRLMYPFVETEDRSRGSNPFQNRIMQRNPSSAIYAPICASSPLFDRESPCRGTMPRGTSNGHPGTRGGRWDRFPWVFGKPIRDRSSEGERFVVGRERRGIDPHARFPFHPKRSLFFPSLSLSPRPERSMGTNRESYVGIRKGWIEIPSNPSIVLGTGRINDLNQKHTCPFHTRTTFERRPRKKPTYASHFFCFFFVSKGEEARSKIRFPIVGYASIRRYDRVVSSLFVVHRT